VVADKRTFNFTIDGVERKATEACVAYLALLQRMVSQFETDMARPHKIEAPPARGLI